MAIYKIQNCSSLKYLDSNIAQLSDFNSTNNERPVLIRMGETNSNTKHTVMVYGYQNACSSMGDLLVLDPANTHNTLDDVGLFFTLSESMQHNSKDIIINYRTTAEK